MSLSPTADNNVRALNWNNQNLIPTELRVSQDPRTMFAMVDIVAETTVDGHGGSSVDFPPPGTIIPLPTPTPTPTPPPGGGGGLGGLVYYVTQSFVGRTRNWNGTSPSWTNITGAISSGSITDFILDPYDPQNKAWVITTTTIYKTTNLDAISPTWTVSQSQTQIETAIGQSLDPSGCGRIISSIEQSGRFTAGVLAGGGVNRHWVGTTTNNGTSWSWVQPRDADMGRPSLDYAEHSGGLKIYDANDNDSDPSRDIYLSTSTNGGAGWSSVSTGYTGLPRDILCPYGGNSDDNILYIVINYTTDRIIKSTNGGTTWTEITPSGFSITEGAGPAGGNQSGFSGYLIGDATTLYACSSDTTSPLWKSTDGGSSWVQVHANLGANARTLGLWPYNSDYIYMALRDGGPYFSTNGGISFASKVGNWATAVGSIALGIQLVPVWTV